MFYVVYDLNTGRITKLLSTNRKEPLLDDGYGMVISNQILLSKDYYVDTAKKEIIEVPENYCFIDNKLTQKV